jgi:hypothetical protein
MTTTTFAQVQARAANFAAVAQDIIASVIESGTTYDVAKTKNSQRVTAPPMHAHERRSTQLQL